MPKASRSDKNNAWNSHRPQEQMQQQQPAHLDMLPSPPTHLPTPLPEEERLVMSTRRNSGVQFDSANLMLSNLIDFDYDSTRDSPQHSFVSLSENSAAANFDTESEPEAVAEDDLESTYRATYRSPPFRVADLSPESSPQDSPPPLPIPPRITTRNLDVEAMRDADSFGGSLTNSLDHIDGAHSREPNFSVARSPTLLSPVSPISPLTSHSQYGHARTPSSPSHVSAYSPSLTSGSSALESITRTFRGIVPTAISSMPSGLPSPPSVSTGVGLGLFSNTASNSRSPLKHPEYTSRPNASQTQEFERDYEIYDDTESTGVYGYGGSGRHGPQHRLQQVPHVQQRRQSQQQMHMASPQARGHSSISPVTHHPQPVHPPMDVHLLANVSSGALGHGMPKRSGLAQAMLRSGPASPRSHHRGVHSHNGAKEVADGELISFARWDILHDRRLLILGYTSGLQIWDCTNMGSVDEVLNVNFEHSEVEGGWKSEGGAFMQVVHAAVLQPPSRQAIAQHKKDPFEGMRPMIGLLLQSSDEDEREQEPQTTFILYSVRNRQHQLVKRLVYTGLPSTFSPNEHFIVISTTTPPTLHILSSTTFDTLHTISSSQLQSFSPPAFTSSPGSALQSTALSISLSNALTTASNKSVSLVGTSLDGVRGSSGGGGGEAAPGNQQGPPAPRPVFALSQRLLAYASPSPSVHVPPGLTPSASGGNRRLSSTSTTSGSGHSVPGSNASVSSSPFGSLGGLGNLSKITQADVGHAALKVGESVFSGVKFLGGMAFEAAKNKVGSGVGGLTVGTGGGLGGNRFVSRSAPDSHPSVDEEAARRMRDRERRHSNSSSPARNGLLGSTIDSTTVAPFTKPTFQSGHYVTILDLSSLLSADKPQEKIGVASPLKIDEFLASRSQPVSRLDFSPDGMSVGVGFRNGHSLKVFKIRPTPGVLLSALASLPNKSGSDDNISGGNDGAGVDVTIPQRGSVSQTYDLRRGRTNGVLESVDWAHDGRWIGVGTRNGTVHIFAVNPYGGMSDVRSHLEGKVRNVDFVETRSTTLTPITRLRGTKSASTNERPKAPLAFTFISTSDLVASPNLLPPISSPQPTYSPTFSPTSRGKRGTNYQHILLFDPEDGLLSLYRLTLDKKVARESGISGVAASVQALGVTSISLPGMVNSGRLSSSPSSKPISAGGRSSELPMELGWKETAVVATYSLRRDKDWKQVSKPMWVDVKQKRTSSGEWLAEAELSTCSTSQRVLPRSLYLSHQFSFHTLGEDYHALIRSYQFHITGSKIDVRKAVEISAFNSAASPADTGLFIEGFSAPRDIHRAPSSFDEPIASAISGSLDSSNIPPILPMYPNGVPGSSNPKSLRNSIPIRAMAGIGDGVSEGLGRIRREMHRVRSPQLNARSDSNLSSVPLEFNEEDEDFLEGNTVPTGHVQLSREASHDGVSLGTMTTPSNNSTQQSLEADVFGTVDEDMFDGLGWDRDDRLAVAEAEQYDDLSTIGQFAEDQDFQHQPAGLPVLPPPGSKKRTKQRRGH